MIALAFKIAVMIILVYIMLMLITIVAGFIYGSIIGLMIRFGSKGRGENDPKQQGE